MKKIKLTIEENNLNAFKEQCNNNYINEKNALNLLKQIIKENKIDFFNYAMKKWLSPENFWNIHKELIKTKKYDFLKSMITIYRDSEPEAKNIYVDQLLFDFILKDDLFFVNYLVEKEKASTENIIESQTSILNECAKSNAIKCFDYFIAHGKNLHDFDDVALFSALENKNYEIVSLILNFDNKIDSQIAKYFFRYGQTDKKPLSNNSFLKLVEISQPAIENNIELQNALNFEYIKRGYLKELELNLEKGHSPIGDEENDLLGLAIMLKKNSIKITKMLLDYGACLTETHKSKLSIENAKEIENYPRYTKIKNNLENKLPTKGKGKLLKI